ncbi:hypothetical protein BGZ95_001949 [Linnemannia exigua]|uniref:CCD97-like C-terminal domain-containing protein n=1 Tax=Linnemannia exigua TaxID=604196 RepID=A0AAD4DJ00_9FUNG|nr:hypothetical protein BGZ95_001949 [Linnemannia exigua]
MPLSQESIATILAYLDPYIDTLETGFPTSTRPNEPSLTKAHKQAKIEATLQKDPAIFLAKWGSVILYPRPQQQVKTTSSISDDSSGVNGTFQRGDTLASAKGVLDLFSPLAVDYEIRHHLTRLYQQLHQLMEHANFEASRQQQHGEQRRPSGSNNADLNSAASNSIHNRSHGYNPTSTTNYMDIDPDASTQQTSTDNRDIPEEDRKPTLGQNDLFTRSTLSQNTRRNRRLNYLLRHLAPPDANSGSAGVSSGGPSASGAASSASSRANNHSKSTGALSSAPAGSAQNTSGRDSRNPTLASILSISGSMANLSFSESTYFSDAEMEARAPELYQQYIGRFMDQDDEDSQGDEEDEEDEDDQGEATGAEDADDEREDNDTRQSSGSPEPFGKDVGLVDRILWNIDHPSRKQLKKQRQEELMNRRAAQGHKTGEGSSSSGHAAGSRLSQDRTTARAAAEVAPKASESEFEEEFDTESEVDDADMEDSGMSQEKVSEQDMEVEKDDRKGPLKDIADDQLLNKTSVTPPIPPTPVPGIVSSTFASAAMTLEQPESRARFATIESGNGLGSSEDEAPELDQATKERKEDQESLRQEFVLLMKQRFLDGMDSQFDYSLIDFDEELDDLEQEDHDVEDRYFDAEDEGDDDLDDDDDGEILDGQLGASRSVGRAGSSKLPMRMNYDERVQAWENSAQNGSGDYDY